MIVTEAAGLHVGTVEMCSPTEIKILLDADAPQDTAFNAGRPQGFPRLNGYVLIPNEGGTVVAVIGRMTMEPAPAPSSNPSSRDMINLPLSRRRLFVTPLGVLETGRKTVSSPAVYRFRRGIASYPAVGDAVALPSPEQLRAVVQASGVDARVHIGNSRTALDTPITIDPDKLFGRHVGVFGNTGSGKSCTVAGLIRWSIEAASIDRQGMNGRFIILDPNGEYRTCFSDLKEKIRVKVFSVEPSDGEEQLVVPSWIWNGHEWSAALEASSGTQRPILMQAIRQLRTASNAGGEKMGTGDAPGAELLLLSSQLRAYADYLRAARAQGVAVLGTFPQFKSLHENMAGMETRFATVRERIPEADPVSEALTNALEVSREVRQRRTGFWQGQDRPGQFQDADIEEILSALDQIGPLLPQVMNASGPSEDMPIPFDPAGLSGMVELLAGLQPGNILQHMAGLDLRVKTLLSDTRIAPIIAPTGNDVTFVKWLSELFGDATDPRGQITVVDLSLVPSDVLATIVAVLGRVAFETAQRYRRLNRVTLPTVIVLEEAHNFVQRQGPDADKASAVDRCRSVFEKIAKEGRKFGIGLMLSSQRPAELSPTIIAQCNSFILHRIVNDRDQELVSRLAPDSTGPLLRELPSLPTQQAILMGIATEIPLVFDVRKLDDSTRPSSENPDYWDVWTGKRPLQPDFEAVVASWLG